MEIGYSRAAASGKAGHAPGAMPRNFPANLMQSRQHPSLTMTQTKVEIPSTASGASGFHTISPKILYFGTPVAIVTSANEDGSANLAPISSFWALGWTVVLGLLRDTKTLANLEANPDCVINLPSPDLWRQVELLAPLTGLDPVPAEKAAKFHSEHDKFRAAELTPLESEVVSVPRVRECPAQLEARVKKIHALDGESKLNQLTGGAAVEVAVERVHLREDYILGENYVDPSRWQPLIYNFRHYYGLGAELGKTFRAEV
jgi:flavin reductase (DIM6/NTAB) family NADH-FMN oxidoreductase RutF